MKLEVRREELEGAMRQLRGIIRRRLGRGGVVGIEWGLRFRKDRIEPDWGDSAYFYNTPGAIGFIVFYSEEQARSFLRQRLNEVVEDAIYILQDWGVEVVS